MMASLPHQLDGRFLLPTPAGSYHLAGSSRPDPLKPLLSNLLRSPLSPQLSLETVLELTACNTLDEAVEMVARADRLGWIEGFDQPLPLDDSALESLLPQQLARLSSNNKALLADGVGFYVANHGFAHETAERLSALAADLLALGDRHRNLLQENMSLNSSAWGVVDAAGNSRVGFWPLHIGLERFILILGGMPLINSSEFTTIIWALTTRYGEGIIHPDHNGSYRLEANAP